MLCAAAFCLAAAFGFGLFLSRKIFASEAKLQKILGLSLLLVSLHILVLNYELLSRSTLGALMQYLLVASDLAALIYIIVSLVRHAAAAPVAKGKEPSAAKIEQEAEVEEANLEQVKEEEEEEVSVREEEEEENVEQLENPNVEDFLFFQKVEALMVNEKLFCEQELSREAVATAIGTNRTYLARSIKSATGKTFSEYITDLRTAYAAKLLSTTDEPLDLIGTLAGFRSKSAYYRAFTAAYGCSPTEYRKNSVIRKAAEN
ncbi:MAG: helix-turn-helix transcriptional regulator [Bacteroidales bacterium]|nr:helix-turn-helix transcriptional regulator [Bacteroidales bacterium]